MTEDYNSSHLRNWQPLPMIGPVSMPCTTVQHDYKIWSCTYASDVSSQWLYSNQPHACIQCIVWSDSWQSQHEYFRNEWKPLAPYADKSNRTLRTYSCAASYDFMSPERKKWFCASFVRNDAKVSVELLSLWRRYITVLRAREFDDHLLRNYVKLLVLNGIVQYDRKLSLASAHVPVILLYLRLSMRCVVQTTASERAFN